MSGVAKESQREDEPSPSRAAIVALMRAADAARRAMTRALQPFDLTLPQYNVLTILRHHDELPTFAVAARMVEATPGITRLMTTLEAKRYIRRVQSAGDRRQQLCSLTEEGRRIVDAAIPRVSVSQRRVVADLNQAEALQLTGLLRRLPASQRATGRPEQGSRPSRPSRGASGSHRKTDATGSDTGTRPRPPAGG